MELTKRKKFLIFFVVLLICGDVSLLFAASDDEDQASPSTSSAAPSANNQARVLQMRELAGERQQLTEEQAKQKTDEQNFRAIQGIRQVATPPSGADSTDSTDINVERKKNELVSKLLKEVNAPNLANPSVNSANQQAVQGKSVDDDAFDRAVADLLPMTPDQIQRLKKAFLATKSAAVQFPGVEPRPVTRTHMVSLQPGAVPPVVRLSEGYASAIMFLDSTGQSWPIEAYDIGDPNSFNIQWNKTDNGLMIQNVKNFAEGNLIVRLRDQTTPVVISLKTAQPAVDYRVDFWVQGYGPNAKPPSGGQGLPDVEDPELLNVLNQISPKAAKVLKVTGVKGQAWAKRGKLYLRTQSTVISPAWVSTLSSADGTHAYEMQPASTVLVSSNGKVTQMKIEGY